jgi:hypothetical protein
MSLAPEPLHPTDFLLRLDCAHATPAIYRVEVQCAERGGTPDRPTWRRQYPRPVLAIPSVDTWMLETLRQLIREVDALLPAHDAADAVAIVTLREWKTGSQKVKVTVTAPDSRAELSLTNWEHCDRPLENGCSGIGDGFSVPMLDVLRRVHGHALTVAAFDVPPLHQTVQESEGAQPDTDGTIANAVESAIHILRRLAREEPHVASSVVDYIRRFEGGLL